MSRRIYDYRKRSNHSRAIDLDCKGAVEQLRSKEKETVLVGEENTLTVSVLRVVKVVDKLRCEGLVYDVVTIEEERPDSIKKGFIIQKLIVKRFR